MPGKSSSEILQEIKQATQNIPKSGIETEDYDTPSTYNDQYFDREVIPSEINLEAEEQEGEIEETSIKDQSFDDPTLKYLREQREEKAQRRKDWDEMSLAEKHEYYQQYGKPDFLENQGQPQVSQQDAQAMMSALETDFLDLTERYGNLVGQFQIDFQLGKVKIPKNQHLIENSLEDLFLNWFGKSKAFSEMNHREIGDIIKKASGPGLLCRSRDLLMPQVVRPKPKPKRKEQTFRMPDISTEDLNEMLRDWARKHPE